LSNVLIVIFSFSIHNLLYVKFNFRLLFCRYKTVCCIYNKSISVLLWRCC